MPEQALPLFVYGTLRDPLVRARVLGRHVEAGPAVRLPDHVALSVRGEAYPALCHRPGNSVTGCLLRTLSAHDLERLDWYEGSAYRLQDCTVLDAVDGRAIPARCYRADKRLLLGDEPWSLERWQCDARPRFLSDVDGWMHGYHARLPSPPTLERAAVASPDDQEP